jgi:uncharacterized protein YijF (DUF1287 family)
MVRKRWILLLLPVLLAGFTNCRREAPVGATSQPASAPTTGRANTEPASEQVGRTQVYDPAYTQITYPGGDVPIEKGVCTDVVIRALRSALQMDLQKLVHEDMKAAFSQYPQLWGLRAPDSNIDHRRVPNLMCYFQRRGWSLPGTQEKEDYLPGDLVTCTVAVKLPHIMIVSDRKAEDGTPLVIHNIGHGAQEESRLFEFSLTGHYRIKQR